MKSQKQIIIEKLKEDGQVSRNWALSNYISRLSAIIYNLKDIGWEFETFKVKTFNKVTKTEGWDYIYKVKVRGSEK